jgi:hypothetical protein
MPCTHEAMGSTPITSKPPPLASRPPFPLAIRPLSMLFPRPLRHRSGQPRLQADKARRVQTAAHYNHRQQLKASMANHGRHLAKRYGSQYTLWGLGGVGSQVRLRSRCVLTAKGRGMASGLGRVSLTTLLGLARQGKHPGSRKL